METSRAIAEPSEFDAPFPYRTNDVEVSQVLRDVTRKTGLPTRIAEGVRGKVSLGGAQATVGELLDEVAAQTGSIWWFDGAMLHVEPASDLTTVLLDSRGLTAEYIRTELDALEMGDDRFPLRTTGDGSVLRVSGPKGYVDQVVLLVATLTEMRRNRVSPGGDLGIYVPRVYYGRVPQ